ncbi:MAG: FKBP-type peptidyl-prolyl cis-trans isomerase [Bacteroidota bacterium]
MNNSIANIELIIIFVVALFVQGCDNDSEPEQKRVDWSQDQSTELNERFTQEEEIAIELFLKQRPSWKVNATGSGLRYWIYEDEPGKTVKTGDQVDVSFAVKKLDGELCYASEEGEVSNFKVDRSDVESGIMEGIKHMSEGDKAKLIIPSHIGHGLLGDFENIPPLQVLVVDLELVKVY